MDDRNGEPLGGREARALLAKKMSARQAGVEVPYVVWTRRDGTPIPVRNMDDHHLYCTIRMLERAAERRAKACNAAGQGATDSADWDCHESAPSEHLGPVYHAMVKVAEARGIDLSKAYGRAAPRGKKCDCWAGKVGFTVRMTTKLLAQRAKCPVHGGKKWSVR
jgi:hypothetical protein